MNVLSRKFLAALTPDNPAALLRLDDNGIFPAPEESLEAFRARLEELSREKEALDHALRDEAPVPVLSDLYVKRSEQIEPDTLAEAAGVTERLYQFHIDWVPGFFLSGEVGWLWGGCAVSEPGRQLPAIFLRRSFQRRRRWFIYRRQELVAHELCHVARTPLNNLRLEEFFAYQTSNSPLRRYLGNCFIGRWDALYFLLPSLLVLAAQICQLYFALPLPVWPFWLLVAAGFGWLLGRNHLARRCCRQAQRRLRQAQTARPLAVLFRCTDAEIGAIAKLPDGDGVRDYVRRKTQEQLRWQIIAAKFFPGVSEP